MILAKINPTSVGIRLARRSLASSSSSKLTKVERELLLKEANEKMKAYYTNRPPIEKIRQSKRKAHAKTDREHYLQALIVGTFFATFVITPFLGKKIATDEAFRKAMVPSWYDFSISRPKSAWTRQEFHEQLIEVQHTLHERAIRGEFSPDKIEEMRRHFDGVDPDEDEHGWGKLHPGLDEDDDIED